MMGRTWRLTVVIKGVRHEHSAAMHVWRKASALFSSYSWLAIVRTECGVLICGQCNGEDNERTRKRIYTAAPLKALSAAFEGAYEVQLLAALTDDEVNKTSWLTSRGEFSRSGKRKSDHQCAPSQTLTSPSNKSRFGSEQIVSSLLHDLFGGGKEKDLVDLVGDFCFIRKFSRDKFDKYIAHRDDTEHDCDDDCLHMTQVFNSEAEARQELLASYEEEGNMWDNCFPREY